MQEEIDDDELIAAFGEEIKEKPEIKVPNIVEPIIKESPVLEKVEIKTIQNATETEPPALVRNTEEEEQNTLDSLMMI